MRPPKMRAEGAAALLIITILVWIAIVATCGCPKFDSVPIQEGGNFTCTLEDGEGVSFSGTLEVSGVGLSRDGQSLLGGRWRLCNDDSGVVCTVEIGTSTAT